MARIGRKTMRRGEAFFEKNIVSGLVAEKIHRDARRRARTLRELGWLRQFTVDHRSSMRSSRADLRDVLHLRPDQDCQIARL